MDGNGIKNSMCNTMILNRLIYNVLLRIASLFGTKIEGNSLKYLNTLRSVLSHNGTDFKWKGK